MAKQTKYGRSPWIERFPKSRVPNYPRYHADARNKSGTRPQTKTVGSPTPVADAVIIGGGLTGCLTAYGLAAAGLRPILIEADRIGRSGTSTTAGWLGLDPDVTFTTVDKALGRRASRHAWHAWRRAALDFAALIRRLRIRCYLEPQRALTVAMTSEQSARLAKDLKLRREASIESIPLNRRAIIAEAALDAASGLRVNDGGTLDPYRACIGVAAAAHQRGARLFERTTVRRVTFTRKIADVFTPAGAIRTRRVIVATGVPTALYGSLIRHVWLRTRYLALSDPVPAKIRQALGRRDSVVRDLGNPPHIVRWLDDERLLVAGADSPSTPQRLREKVTVQRTGQLMYELSTLYPAISGIQPEYGWSEDYARTVDGLPYIGPHRNFPHHLFAFGDSSHGVAGAYLASRILVRSCINELDRADETFGFNR